MNRDRMRRAGLVILALILVTTGSYVRTRSVDQSDTVDWLVILQLGLSITGGLLGLLLTPADALRRFGARLLAVYLMAISISGLFSPYSTQVFGYWTLLAGTAVLCAGLVFSSTSESSLRQVELLILGTLTFMLLKDAILDALVFSREADRMADLGIDFYRFGEGSTSSNSMGLTAAMAFWMSFGEVKTKRGRAWSLFTKTAFVVIVCLTRTRVALAALVIGAILRWWFTHWRSRSRSYGLLVAIPCIAGSAALLIALSWLWHVPIVSSAVELVNRGESSETIMSVTGRTDIWSYAIRRVFDGPISILFGHGYGVSKYVLNVNNWNAAFFAYHAHNTFLEVLLSTGLSGLVPFVILVGYSLNWLVQFSRVLNSFSFGFALRAISVVSAILISTMTEAELVTKTEPVVVVFLFYLLSLDRCATFLRSRHLYRK
jgi:O-antigen ligase